MSYAILRPGESRQSGGCALAVMAKAPRAGQVKTRLSPPLTSDEAAELNVCFIRDRTENIQQVTMASNSLGSVAYTPVGDESAFDGILPVGFCLLAQRGEGFGARLRAAAEDLFACGFASLCLIDADSPTLPQTALVQAVELLERPGDRVVLGGCDDGGYYLIGLKRLHARLFEEIDWSTERVMAQTMARAKEIGLETALLPTWYDVDDSGSLARLCSELLSPTPLKDGEPRGYEAKHTKAYLRKLRLAAQLTQTRPPLSVSTP